ncbi:acyltransferase [Apiospora arundinis]|uniref:Acyltransferase n=1 Tax=Apiospora arundinis TaxID=335852 RepID=A0ABR2IBR4_9PEZI
MAKTGSQHGNGLLDDLDMGEIEANKPPWEPDWKPATQIRLRAKRTLVGLTNLARRLISPFRPKGVSKGFSSRKELRPTAYLDGLRGFAAFLVYWHHHELWAHGSKTGYFEHAFAYEGNYHFAALPFFRFFFAGGHFAVSTFFVISGYVLSTKPLSLIHEREYVKLGDSIASALFRRWLRLYLPFIVTTFVYMSCWHALDLWIVDVEKQESWAAEVWNWYADFKNFSFVFNSGGPPWFSYNFHLWSIPIEFRGSIVIYTSLLAFSRCSKNTRLWCETALIFYFMYITDAWYCAMFVSGMLLCDLDLLAKKQRLPLALSKLGSAKNFIFYHLLAISFYLGGVPEANRDIQVLRKMRGWYYLSFLKPQAFFDYKWFYLFWAATLLVAATPRIPWLKSFFEGGLCQYLGRISYSLYLVHGPMIWTLGDRIYTAVGWYQQEQLTNLHHWADKAKLPQTGPLGLEISFLLPQIILLPLTIWLAEIVTRLVDEPSVRFAQWLYSRTLPLMVKE